MEQVISLLAVIVVELGLAVTWLVASVKLLDVEPG